MTVSKIMAQIVIIVILGCFHVSPLCADVISLRDGRVFQDAEIFSQSPLSVMIRHHGGINSVPKKLLPDNLLVQYPLDQKAAAEAKIVDEKAANDSKAKEVSNEKTRKAAANGDPGAQFEVGNMYFTGTGVARDIAESAKWYRQSAEQGDARAQFSLARMYDSGAGLSKDTREAAKWYRKAAEQGNSDAQSSLGLLYQKGFGVQKCSCG